MERNSTRRSTLAMAVLSMLNEAEQYGQRSLHPYKMQRLIKDRGKDEVVNVEQRASLYRTIDRLHSIGLIRTVESRRDKKRPEKTLYEITDKGKETWRNWILDALAVPTRNYPEFPAAMAFIPLLKPDEVLAQLKKRRGRLVQELDRITVTTEDSTQWGRLFFLEMEYLRTMTSAELEWVDSVIGDLQSQSITWSPEWLHSLQQESTPSTVDE